MPAPGRNDLLHDLAGTLVNIGWGLFAAGCAFLGRLGLKAFEGWVDQRVEEKVKATQGPLISDIAQIRADQSAILKALSEHVQSDALIFKGLTDTLERIEEGQREMREDVKEASAAVIRLDERSKLPRPAAKEQSQ